MRDMYRLIFEYPVDLVKSTPSPSCLPGFLPSIECFYCSEVLPLSFFKDDSIVCLNCGTSFSAMDLKVLTKCAEKGLRHFNKLIKRKGSSEGRKGRLCSLLRVLKVGRRGEVAQ
jgi:hypothetical protein